MQRTKQIKRVSKDAFRKIVSVLPQGVKSYMTGKYISRMTAPLLPVSDLRACESDPQRRDTIVQAHKKKHPKQVEELHDKIRSLLSDESFGAEAATFSQADMEYAYFAYGFQPREYFMFHLDKRDIHTFVSNLERQCVKQAMNDFTQSVFADKAKVYAHFRQWYKRDAVMLETPKDYSAYVKFVSAHPKYVVKIVNSSRGQGVWTEEAGSDLKDSFRRILRHGKVLLEEPIEQHELMKRFNPTSVNTVRVAAYLTREGVYPAHGFFRTGQKGSFTDNVGAGGLQTRVDVQRGIITSDAGDHFRKRYEKHPDSGIVFKGFALPEWDAALKIVREAALLFPEIKYKSFDLAYTDKGWVIVEINPSGEYIQADMETGMKEIVRSMMEKMDLMFPYTLR